MVWQIEYTDNMTELFDTEQAYVDAAFVLIVLYNFGTFLDTEDLHDEEGD